MRTLLLLLLLSLTSLARAAGPVCAEIGTVCTDGPRTVIIDGMHVSRPCWQRTTRFACIAPAASDDCAPLRQRGCSEQGAACLEHATVAGAPLCTTEEHTYTCTAAGTQTVTSDCAGQQYCIDGNCFDTGTPPDGDFKQSVAALQVAREAGVHLDQDTLQVFTGKDNRCSKTVLKNCCRGGAAAQALTSPALPDVDERSGQAAPMAQNDSAHSALSTRTANMALNDHGARAVLQCRRDEVLTTQQRDQGLCHYVGTYCSHKISLGFAKLCIEHSESYCCFRSKIARIVAEAAREQLPALGWGRADHPVCNGLTVAQFQSLDLSKVDFSPVYDDIRPRPFAAQPRSVPPRATRSYFDSHRE